MDTEGRGSKDQLRSVVCETHGLRYDAQTQSGCVRCRDSEDSGADGRQTLPRRGGPPLVVWLLVGGAALLLGVLMFGGGDPDRPDDPAVAPGPSRAASSADGTTRTATDDSREIREVPTESSQPAAINDGWPTYEAEGSITIEDAPEDETFRIGDLLAPDLESVRFRAMGGVLEITFEFTRTLDFHAFDLATGFAPASVFVDSDLDPTTGEKGFAGREGFERAVQSYVGVKYDADAETYWWVNGMPETPIVQFACSHDVGSVNGFFLDATFDPSDEEARENSSCFGTSLEVRVPYERLGVAAGQTVRLATQEDMGSGKVPQYFLADVLLTLE